jgi:hypothetical protein
MTDDRDAKLANYAGQIEALMKRRDELEAALGEIERLAGEHADMEADPLDRSPEDMNTWRNGVICQICQKARGV